MDNYQWPFGQQGNLGPVWPPLDANANRIEQLYRFLNTFSKSRHIDIRPVLKELVSLLNLPPETLYKTPTMETP
jgi:hypothetical protein